MAAFLIIGSVWMMVVGGAAMKIRAERLESIDSFQRQLRAFAGGPPALDDGRSVPAALNTPELLRRILAALLVTVVCSFLYALAARSRVALGLSLLMLDMLLAYVGLLVYRRDKAAGTLALLAGPGRERVHPPVDDRPVRRGRVPATIT